LAVTNIRLGRLSQESLGIEVKEMTEQDVIEQLSQYRQMQARLKVLSTYTVGMGITVSRLNQDDQLQELHRRLRRLPSYMYLSKHELELETTAHAYLRRYPVGTRAQLNAVPKRGIDAEDDKLLKELREKIKKVIAARGGDVRDDIDEVLERLAEYQDLQAEIDRIDTVLAALEAYRPEYAKLLRLRYIEGVDIGEIRTEMRVSPRTFWRRMADAEREYVMLAR
jgi:flagellar biosynthesis chaperone FliJ